MAGHAHTKQIASRLARAAGHLTAVKRMVEEERSCPEVLIQIAAVRSALDATARLLLADHLEHCVLASVQDGDVEKHLAELRQALDRFIA